MKIDAKSYRVKEGEKVDLDKRPTKVAPVYASKAEYREILDQHIAALKSAQARLYADERFALLFILQGMDAAGKDGVIKHVMSGVNPQGCQVFSFKHPSVEELKHDFLWRTIRNLPERGKIGIFNRSHYEEVLIVRVHPEILASEGLTGEVEDGAHVWKGRHRSIVDFEQHLHRCDTRIVKFFLHLSKEEQRKRFLARIDEPEKNWKFSLDDAKERQFWDQYRKAYEKCLSATSTDEAPWHIVPADDKKNARLIVSQIILDTIEALDLRYPVVDAARRQELEETRKRLLSEADD